jgi:hypothetical protein
MYKREYRYLDKDERINLIKVSDALKGKLKTLEEEHEILHDKMDYIDKELCKCKRLIITGRDLIHKKKVKK